MSSLPGFLLMLLLVAFSFSVQSQINRVGGGLSFSSGVDFNMGSSGNPGLNLKAYSKINRRLFIKPELTIFNRFSKGNSFYSLTNYMIHFDIDGQYGILKEDKIILFCFGGLNTTTVISRYTSHINVGSTELDNDSSIRPGLNLGAGLKMHIDRSFDGVLQTKYIAGSFSQLVISVGAVYHIDGNNRGSW